VAVWGGGARLRGLGYDVVRFYGPMTAIGTESPHGVNTSVIGRLLEEISWEGRRARQYRQGGRGKENVLSAQVLQALDLLPRTAFLGRVIHEAHGADEARARVVKEVEDLSLVFLPDEVALAADGVRVQADALLTGPTTLVLVEAKASAQSPFQPAQLSREFRALLQQAGNRTPLMLLILGAPPPVKVSGRGLLDPLAALSAELQASAPEASGLDELLHRAFEILAWTTWSSVATAVADEMTRLKVPNQSVAASVRRTGQSLVDAVGWHASR